MVAFTPRAETTRRQPVWAQSNQKKVPEQAKMLAQGSRRVVEYEEEVKGQHELRHPNSDYTDHISG